MENSEYETLSLSPVSAPFARPRETPFFTGILSCRRLPSNQRLESMRKKKVNISSKNPFK
jgi:hypothetical protein